MKNEIVLLLRGVKDEYALFNYAVELSRKLSCALTLVHVIDNPKESARILNLNVNDAVSARESAARENINAWRMSVDEMPGMETLVIDETHDDIDDWLNTRDVNLVIVGHHQYIVDFSLANQLIKKLQTPVLIYPLGGGL